MVCKCMLLCELSRKAKHDYKLLCFCVLCVALFWNLPIPIRACVERKHLCHLEMQ